MLNFREEAEQIEDYIIEQRRYFHRHPELSFEEKETTKVIGKQLEAIGLTPFYFDGYYGVWTMIEGGKATKERKTIALRADIDALPIEEKTGASYASLNPGVMHACGHDCHIAMLLGAARLLYAHKEELQGNVKLIFQAAEESCHGAEYYVKNGFLDDVDAIYGSHVWPNVDSRYLNADPGARMASCDNFTITVTGHSAHGSSPNEGVDAIVTAASIIMQIQTLVSRKNDPRNPLVITIGEISGGQRFNVIAGQVVMKGTVRTHSPEVRRQVEGWIRNLITHTAAADGAEAVLEYEYYPAPLINDEALAQIARNAVTKLYGEETLQSVPAVMGSEDFSYFTDKIPGMYAFIGVRNEEKNITPISHNENFNVDESALKRGTALYAQFAYDYLGDL